jgi:hypothetical protein
MIAFRAKPQRFLVFVEEIGSFSAQNGTDNPNPIAARAWQRKEIKKMKLKK